MSVKGEAIRRGGKKPVKPFNVAAGDLLSCSTAKNGNVAMMRALIDGGKSYGPMTDGQREIALIAAGLA